MRWVEIMPIIMGVLVAGYVIQRALVAGRQAALPWLLPAGAALALLLWTMIAAWHEGTTGFWPEHTRNLWGNQIWFDLLLAAAVALSCLLPRAHALGMRVLPWTLVVLATGSIGLLAMFARVMQLEARATRRLT